MSCYLYNNILDLYKLWWLIFICGVSKKQCHFIKYIIIIYTDFFYFGQLTEFKIIKTSKCGKFNNYKRICSKYRSSSTVRFVFLSLSPPPVFRYLSVLEPRCTRVARARRFVWSCVHVSAQVYAPKTSYRARALKQLSSTRRWVTPALKRPCWTLHSAGKKKKQTSHWNFHLFFSVGI